MPLLWVLRDVLGLTGTKYGCGIEICGACSVLVNGQAEKSCDMSVSEAVGKKIVTIEGISANRSHPIQKAWIAHQVPQCGYCQSGVIVCAAGQYNAGQKSGIEIENLCVCGTYQRMREALQTV